MIEYKTGNILAEDADALVNTVNCVGVMGRGIALQFKKAFPENFKAYEKVCRRGELEPGNMFVFDTRQLTNPRYIINFPTKRHWRGRSRLADIDMGLKALLHEIKRLGLTSIAIPPLGSGLGGLRWQDVREHIEEALKQFTDVRVIVYEPRTAAESGVICRSREVPNMTRKGWIHSG
jgi:O-acetyl-ADP-ribose deacetylase (regulator of RNase III)